MKTLIAITLAAIGILSAGAAEATPVTNGFYHTTAFEQDGTFSGANFAVSMTVGGGVFGVSSFNTGTINGGVGVGTIFTSPSATVQIGINSCTASPGEDCGAMLTFMFAPNLLPSSPSTADAPFTFSGLLTVGNVTLNIEGGGFLHATRNDFVPGGGEVRFDFLAPEPSSLILVLIGLVAVSWSRWRFGKRAGSSRSIAAAD